MSFVENMLREFRENELENCPWKDEHRFIKENEQKNWSYCPLCGTKLTFAKASLLENLKNKQGGIK